MKPKKAPKLSLKKATIASFDKINASHVKGGAHTDSCPLDSMCGVCETQGGASCPWITCQTCGHDCTGTEFVC
jgi:hypothetical protein